MSKWNCSSICAYKKCVFGASFYQLKMLKSSLSNSNETHPSFDLFDSRCISRLSIYSHSLIVIIVKSMMIQRYSLFDFSRSFQSWILLEVYIPVKSSLFVSCSPSEREHPTFSLNHFIYSPLDNSSLYHLLLGLSLSLSPPTQIDYNVIYY